MTAIDDKYAQLGGVAGFLGAPLIPESPTPDGSGAYRHFQGGSIYWSETTGAHEVHGEIRNKWQELLWEHGFLGYPVTDETATPNGAGQYNHFQGGSIYWTQAIGAHEVHGAILEKWGSFGWENSVIGFPLSDELVCADGVGRHSEFEWGSIYWTPGERACEVHGFIRGRWDALGRETGSLGYPMGDEHDFAPEHHDPSEPDDHGVESHDHPVEAHHPLTRASAFQGGAIYWDTFRGPYEVYNPPPPQAVDPTLQGHWETAPFSSGVVGVHSALLHTNKVLFFTYLDPGPGAPEMPQDHGDSVVLDLETGAISKPQQPAGNRNLFCAGHAFLPDGKLLIAGGERMGPGLRSLHVFDPEGPDGGTWQYVRDMGFGRWYPTPVTLPDGRIFILGGAHLAVDLQAVNSTYEIFDPGAGPQPAHTVNLLQEVGGFTTFPFVYVLPNGKLFMHAGTRTRFMDLATWSVDPVAIEAAARPGRNARTYGVQGTSVLLPLRPDSVPPYRARVMVIGGGGAAGNDIREPTTETCEMLDLGAASPAWKLTASMARPRVMPDSVLLPDGKVLVMNGSSSGFSDNGANPVFETELYDPEADAWTPMARMSVPRLYHSGALLLPDGRVMTCGSDSMWNPGPFHVNQLRLEMFSPPYLFAGARPVILNSPQEVSHGALFEVETADAATVDAVVLTRCGSTTHSFNPDQRLVGIEITTRTATALTLQAPPDGFVAPLGYYLLFLLRGGVPSVARFVRLAA